MQGSSQELFLPDAVDGKLVPIVIVVLVSGVEARRVVEVANAVESDPIAASRSERSGHSTRNSLLPLFEGVADVCCVPTVPASS
jgi:hypothetical protein